jgi:hypothetical protein
MLVVFPFIEDCKAPGDVIERWVSTAASCRALTAMAIFDMADRHSISSL